jgi:hypothetical protein
VLTFSDGTIQRSKSARLFNTSDLENEGITTDDFLPGDFFYDTNTQSIFIMIDTGEGFWKLLDITVRGGG